jgi:hypothetical protein
MPHNLRPLLQKFQIRESDEIEFIAKFHTGKKHKTSHTFETEQRDISDRATCSCRAENLSQTSLNTSQPKTHFLVNIANVEYLSL